MSNPEKWRGFELLPADIEARLAALPNWLAAQGVRLAYLFGSLADAERPHPANDVDLAVLMPPDLPAWPLLETLCEVLGSERLDLVDLRRVTPEFRFAIISGGRCLFAADEDERLDFELAAVREYHDRAHWRRLHEELMQARFDQWSSNAKVSTND